MSASNNRVRARRKLLLVAIAAGMTLTATASAAHPMPVLMVLANQDFHYAEYAATRASLEARGLAVVVAAGESRPAQPQGAGAGRAVQPNLALEQASEGRYSAIVFVGGWGASSYQYAFSGTYQNAAYRGQPAVTREVNRLIEQFSSAGKPIAGISHGVTVLAWARVDGSSPLDGRVVVGPASGTPAFRLRGIDYPNAEQPARWQVEMNGAAMLTSGSVGNPMSTTDDVWVDGRIITAESHDASGRFAEVLAQSIAANRN